MIRYSKKKKENLTPKTHKDSKENGGGIIEEIAQRGEFTAIYQLLVSARLVAKRAQRDVSRAVRIADFFARRVVVAVHRRQAVEETQGADYGGGVQHFRVETQPAEVQGYLVSEVFPHQVQRLLLVPFRRSGPF